MLCIVWAVLFDLGLDIVFDRGMYADIGFYMHKALCRYEIRVVFSAWYKALGIVGGCKLCCSA